MVLSNTILNRGALGIHYIAILPYNMASLASSPRFSLSFGRGGGGGLMLAYFPEQRRVIKPSILSVTFCYKKDSTGIRLKTVCQMHTE